MARMASFRDEMAATPWLGGHGEDDDEEDLLARGSVRGEARGRAGVAGAEDGARPGR